MSHDVQINRVARRFEIVTDGGTAVLTFKILDSVLWLIHTEVPEALRGQHLGEDLARFALEYARSRGMPVRPYCRFVAAYIERHPEYRDLVEEGWEGSD